jgi:hypothetical protein
MGAGLGAGGGAVLSVDDEEELEVEFSDDGAFEWLQPNKASRTNGASARTMLCFRMFFTPDQREFRQRAGRATAKKCSPKRGPISTDAALRGRLDERRKGEQKPAISRGSSIPLAGAQRRLKQSKKALFTPFGSIDCWNEKGRV